MEENKKAKYNFITYHLYQYSNCSILATHTGKNIIYTNLSSTPVKHINN